MLSIVIPTYNMDCLRLVTDLQQQCEELEATFEATFEYEIIVADDCSTNESVISRNEMMEFLPNCEYVRMEANVGRAALCNWLFETARYEYVLMIDADAAVISEDFLLSYWENRQPSGVVVGGIATPKHAPRGHELRLKYELAADKQRALSYRQSHPYDNFSTFNVLFHQNVLQKIVFDHRISEYGYEDALMGVRLSELSIPITHIDNPLLHTGINSNESFLKNSEAALRMLHTIGSPMIEKARVSQTYMQLQKYHLVGCLRFVYHLFHSFLRKNLCSRWPSLWAFALYKLGYYADLCATLPTNNLSSDAPN